MTDRIDDAIDGAVREMLDVEPPSDLRERVIAQLPAAGFRLPASGSLTEHVASGFSRNRAMFTASAVAAAVVLAVFVARRSDPLAPQTPIAAHGTDRHLPAEIARVPAPRTVTTPTPTAVVATAAPRPAPATGTVQAASLSGDTGETAAVEPLTTIAPIAVQVIARRAIAPAEITVPPLNTIADLQIAPLTPPDRRN